MRGTFKGSRPHFCSCESACSSYYERVYSAFLKVHETPASTGLYMLFLFAILKIHRKRFPLGDSMDDTHLINRKASSARSRNSAQMDDHALSNRDSTRGMVQYERGIELELPSQLEPTAQKGNRHRYCLCPVKTRPSGSLMLTVT